MKLSAIKPFYVIDKIGLYKYIYSPGYSVKVMTVGRNGIEIGECDDNFNLVSIADKSKSSLVLKTLERINKNIVNRESFKDLFVEKSSRLMLIKHYKISKYI